MKTPIIITFLSSFLLANCSLFPGPRDIDWKKEWAENKHKLKRLKNDILVKGGKKYATGNNDFPDDFDYPFDDGFFIDFDTTQKIDPKKITITFYMDRGLMDHYSAIVFTNDSSSINEFDQNVANGGNDFKIEPNWYVIND